MLFASTLFIAAFIGNSMAQNSSKKFIMGPSAEKPGLESKAVKSFERSHPNINGEKWRSADGNHIVTFKEHGIKNKIVYMQNGQVDYALKIYDEDALPRQVRAAVKSIYYDYSITGVQELYLGKKIIHLIRLKGANTWKTIRVSNGDVDEIESLAINQ